MTEIEKSARRNIDYSASAVNLVNPKEIEEKLIVYHQKLMSLATLKEELEAEPQYQRVKNMQNEVAAIEKDLYGLIDQFGSYQDLERGWYAVKQHRVNYIYDPTIFKKEFPEFALVVIKEIVDMPRLQGLIKGGLIDTKDLFEKGTATENVTFAYIVR